MQKLTIFNVRRPNGQRFPIAAFLDADTDGKVRVTADQRQELIGKCFADQGETWEPGTLLEVGG